MFLHTQHYLPTHIYTSFLPHAGFMEPRSPRTDLHGQADGVEQDEDKHQVLKVGGVDHVPHFVLVLVLGDVPPQGPGLKGIFHALSLEKVGMAQEWEKVGLVTWVMLEK